MPGMRALSSAEDRGRLLLPSDSGHRPVNKKILRLKSLTIKITNI